MSLLKPPTLDASLNDEERFWKAVKISLVAHALLFIITVITHIAMPGTPKLYIPSVRVDLVDLPDLKKTDIRPPNSDLTKLSQQLDQHHDAPKPQAEPVDDTMSLTKQTTKKDRKKNLQAALDRIKALAELENTPDRPVKGNRVSKGSQLTGETSENVNEYVDHLVTKIRSHWDLPLWLTNQRLSAKVLLFLNARGQIDKLVFVKPSGNEQFDSYVRKTVSNAAPFNSPPSDIESNGIMLGFPL